MANGTPNENWTKDELLEFAAEKEVDVDATFTKAEILEALDEAGVLDEEEEVAEDEAGEAEEKPKKKGKSFTDVKAGFYKGYDIKWLKAEKENHPDGYLVDEYEEKYGVIE